MKTHSFPRLAFTTVILGWALSGCSRCSILKDDHSFQGIISSERTPFQIPVSGGRFEIRTKDIGDVVIQVAPETFSGPLSAELRTAQDKELDEEFQSNPASSNLQRYPGEFHLILGKRAPKKEMEFCFEQNKLLQEGKDLGIMPLVYWIYDGENEILPYFDESTTRIDSVTHQRCFSLEATEFGPLNNAEGRFEVAILFGKKAPRK
jgi:hypothetical protein